MKTFFLTCLMVVCSSMANAQLPNWVGANTRMAIQDAQRQYQQQVQQNRYPQNQGYGQPMTISPETQALIESYQRGSQIPRVNNSDYSINRSSVNGTTYQFNGPNDTHGMTGSSSSSSGSNYSAPQQRQRTAQACKNCAGRGVCPVCNGRGTYQVGVSGRFTRCHCGNGRCAACGGSGVGGYIYR